MRLQADYDLFQARRRLVRSGAIAADSIHPDPRHEPDWDPDSIPLLEAEPEPALAS